MAVPDDRRQHIAAMRRFNRFYTRQIGILQKGLLRSPFPLTQVRLLYELAHRERPAASELSKDLRLDAGYMSRMLGAFERRGLIRRAVSEADARRSFVQLTRKGRDAFAVLDARSDEEIATMLAPLSTTTCEQLIAAMQVIERILVPGIEPAVPYIIRHHRPGDMGWVVHRHGVLYAQEYGWDERFEALVARVVAEFIEQYDPQRERCWIAERNGKIVGSVLLVKKSKLVAKLRLLFVEPESRGLRIGSRLVEECITAARAIGYKKMTLWTNDVLHTARHIYERAGFRLVSEEPHHSFGRDLVGQTWELEL